ncbi:ABC transporter substrate-binding protein [Paenibacillus macerans]|uniref:ABC transporter substrate-binding protein n=1 Tax=Paenibacillus macerans TaxID=44252 RepID=UPI002DB8AF3F|nr:MqnA/MqnD/SBP family protein [Paenibacillus macerans]MEC0331689.1 ABC transporter substrate-binding protein [Paenibacillus macerans]
MKKTFTAIYPLLALFLAGTMIFTGCSGPSAAPSQPDANGQQQSAAGTAAVEPPGPAAQKMQQLTVQGPLGITISAPIYNILENQALASFADEVVYTPWKTPDELRARISSGQADISAVPTYVGSNLYNRGIDVKLLNTLVWGILYVVGPENETGGGWETLRGQTIHVPLKGDMPDLVFRYLLRKNNLDPEKDIRIEYVAGTQELVGLMAAGKAKYAVIPEHLATMAVQKVEGTAKIMSLQEEWAKATGKPARIPQAGILVSGELVKNQPELVESLQRQFQESVTVLNQHPDKAAKMIAEYQEGLEPAFIESLIPALNLEFVSAKDAREELEFFFTELSSLSPDIIGGKLPDDAFYYDK